MSFQSASHRLKVIFMGTPEFAVPSFKAVFQSEQVIAVVTQPDRPKGRGMILQPSPIKEEALKQSLPVYQSERIRQDAALIKTLSDLAPDVIVVVAFGQILPETVLNIPALGCINVHASLLPQYRGAAPIQWALIRGEKETGVTTMMMDKGMDTGPILLQQSLEIQPSETADRLALRLSQQGASLLVLTLKQIKAGLLTLIPQKEASATMARLLKKEDGFICWQDTAEAIFNQWRGVFVWPATTLFYGQESWKIISMEIGEREGTWGKPGEILKVSERGIEIATGIGYIVVSRFKLTGGRALSPKEYAAGHSLKIGSFFSTKEV
jgi:methionyl-tRNA formyltransferase